MKTKTNWLLAGLLLANLSGVALAGGEFTEQLHQTYPLNAGGRISVDNVNGAVHIRAWDRPEVQLDAVKSAKSKEDLAAVEIEIEAKPDRVAIQTKYPSSSKGHKSHSTSVDYTLMVPQSARLDSITDVNGAIKIEGVRGPVKASTVNGSISARGLAANTDVSSVNGEVGVSFAGLEAVKSVSASTVNGSVKLDLPAGANADVCASTVNGSIGGDVSVKKNWPVGAEVKTRLGEGGTSIKASTVNGSLEIHLVKPAK